MPRKLDPTFDDPAALTKYRWELPLDPTSADKYATDISVLKHAVDLEFRFWSLEAMALTMVGARFLKDFDFQPRLAFMNNTFRICVSELAHFMFVLLFMLSMNGLMLHLTIGTFISRCSTLWGSFVYSSELIASGFLDTNELYPHTTMWTGLQWFPVYLGMYGIPVIILWAALNFLLAIIGDAYAVVKEEASTSKTLYAEGLEFFGYWMLARGFPAADLNVQYRIMCNAGVPINQAVEVDSESGMSSGEKQTLRDTYNATLNGLIAGHRRKRAALSADDDFGHLDEVMEDNRGGFRRNFKRELANNPIEVGDDGEARPPRVVKNTVEKRRAMKHVTAEMEYTREMQGYFLRRQATTAKNIQYLMTIVKSRKAAEAASLAADVRE